MSIMHRACFALLLLLHPLCLSAQDTEGYFLKDPVSGCTVWFKHIFAEDSVSWNGPCQNGYAHGTGIAIGYTRGKETSRYTGEMKNGKPDGNGIFILGNERKLEGYFTQGELLNLDAECLSHLHKNIISASDSLSLYVGDNNLQSLYYHAIVPDSIQGCLVLLPGTWETTEHCLSSTAALCREAYTHHLAVLVLSINQRLTLTDGIVTWINRMLSDAMNRYALPSDRFVLGGWSMGGLFSLRYTELAHQYPKKTAIRPAAVFSCDGPCDLENIYTMFQRKVKKNNNSTEALYGIRELEKYCGGAPDKSQKKYRYYSCYSHALADGGNAQFLKNVPVRIYNDVDPNWWMENRGQGLYDMNALDQTAMILLLNEMGNPKAEFINAFRQGYRIEGNRHPHSWSVIEPVECVRWVLQCINPPQKN